jgi:hypothetical protein
MAARKLFHFAPTARGKLQADGIIRSFLQKCVSSVVKDASLLVIMGQKLYKLKP